MKTLIIKETPSLLHVSLNRPESRNAFQSEMVAELTKTFQNAAKKPTLRMVLLSGEGTSFCAGADLDWMKSMINFTQSENVKDAEKLFNMFQAIRDCSLPIVCKVQGHVMGGALGLVAVSDLVVAEEKTKFCFSEVKLGLAPAVISAFVKHKVPTSAMLRWSLTGDVFSAQDAMGMGLVHSVQPGLQIDAQVETWSRSLMANGPQAVRETKKLVQNVARLESDAKMKIYTSRVIAKLRVSDEGQEGLKCAIERKKPTWGNG
jgi:methylglutaconyl-CoA hydratase